MALTPVEIRHLMPPRATFRGYKVEPTDKLFEEIAASFEDVWRERADLADKVEQLEADLVRFRELEALLRTTLISAEHASAQTRDQARREAELILDAAHAEARDVQRRALAENERLQHQSRRMRAQLREALSAFDEPEGDEHDIAAATNGEPETEAAEERSWFGYPNGPAERAVDAA